MAIHEKSLIRPEDIITHDNLIVDGVDVSGDWSTFIRSRVVTDYNESMEEEISSLPGGEYIHRCWQCGSCTNSCTVHAENPDFNPRYWIYLIRVGMESELLRDKEIIWQCVSCNKCTSICPRDVIPEGVMKATSRWMELKGHTPPSESHIFDEVFTHQVIKYGKIEDSEVLRDHMKKTGRPLMQDWFVQMVKNMMKGLPVIQLMKMGIATVIHPKTKNWDKSRAAIEEHVAEERIREREVLGLEPELDAAE